MEETCSDSGDALAKVKSFACAAERTLHNLNLQKCQIENIIHEKIGLSKPDTTRYQQLCV